MPARNLATTVNSDNLNSSRGSRSGHFALVALTTMALALTSSAAPAAGLLARVSLETLQTRSDVVAIGTVVTSHALFLDGTIQTSTTLAVQRSFKGADGATLTILTPGGTYGNVRLIVRGSPSFTVGEEVLVFLYEDAAGLHPTGMFQGVWRLFSGADPEFAAAAGQIGIGRPLPAGVPMARPSSSGGATLVDLEPGPYAVDGGPRGIPELLGSLVGGGL